MMMTIIADVFFSLMIDYETVSKWYPNENRYEKIHPPPSFQMVKAPIILGLCYFGKGKNIVARYHPQKFRKVYLPKLYLPGTSKYFLPEAAILKSRLNMKY
jgi:hypothetical protein